MIQLTVFEGKGTYTRLKSIYLKLKQEKTENLFLQVNKMRSAHHSKVSKLNYKAFTF